MYGFTGEQTDNTGMVFLRARFYGPQWGRFVTADSWPGDYRRPLSLNRWVYTEGNPVNHTDPTGHIPLFEGSNTWNQNGDIDNDDRDLTDWLTREMRADAASAEVDLIRRFNFAGNLSAVCAIVVGTGLTIVTGPGGLIVGGLAGAGATSFKLEGGLAWRDLVKDGARWDFKDQILLEVGNSIRLCNADGCSWFDYSTPGNIFYGYVGRAAGFTSLELHAGATYAQQVDPENVPELNAWHGDQPTDFEAIEVGVEMYRHCGRNTTLTCFQNALKRHLSGMALSAPPANPYYSPYGTTYPVGHFDGDGIP